MVSDTPRRHYTTGSVPMSRNDTSKKRCQAPRDFPLLPNRNLPKYRRVQFVGGGIGLGGRRGFVVGVSGVYP